jgi:hypothetical protein
MVARSNPCTAQRAAAAPQRVSVANPDAGKRLAWWSCMVLGPRMGRR